ncbi:MULTISPECIES: LacI family DNA-binding transcriptional regulator [Rhizobium]|uniref:LacI family DNA-binding transcriptional regulator n=1 Tax=Rhizobium TaxID=379 RepID=UPI001B3409BF|nr:MULTISPECIES: LacI family DNA-binding transcriptional regulator [Rhizobium]MBX4909936.1 LacI family DNA-binding transcriptional regulator [Rhizobium bangladeshense]MBX5217508.1 LacI family DNA-binding transcriptional regulator [Rhizobium sp. NLR9a]MBX5223695.1 LacI family DNA-binding transcriptional regulator [Rhizobium sp. NLR8a]MBX5228966.1 LacI family DNA-binding transcriptional regulator [Rhizobium sp. NLR9b]MBX5235602.1 LacI family DNA-binding transcriptional regulator [Rhizobium sp. N
MTTISAVARAAGVSVSTVSHVLNKTRYVSPEKAKLVMEAVDAIGYIPNAVARSLKLSSTGTVGLAISAISNPYFSDIICAIEAECSKRGLIAFLCDTQDDPDRELELVRHLHRRRVDGIILAPSGDPKRSLDYLIDCNLPCVLVDRLSDDRFDQVGTDNTAAIRMLVDHLVALHHERIGIILGQPGFATTVERTKAFRAAMAEKGIEVPPAFISNGNSSTADATASTHRLLELKEPPTAILASNNLAMIGTMRAIRERGLRVPVDISVLGIDDFEWADYFEPRLTLMAQPCDEIGYKAADLLIQRIGDKHLPRQTVRLSPVLRIRQSCGEAA